MVLLNALGNYSPMMEKGMVADGSLGIRLEGTLDLLLLTHLADLIME